MFVIGLFYLITFFRTTQSYTQVFLTAQSFTVLGPLNFIEIKILTLPLKTIITINEPLLYCKTLYVYCRYLLYRFFEWGLLSTFVAIFILIIFGCILGLFWLYMWDHRIGLRSKIKLLGAVLNLCFFYVQYMSDILKYIEKHYFMIFARYGSSGQTKTKTQSNGHTTTVIVGAVDPVTEEMAVPVNYYILRDKLNPTYMDLGLSLLFECLINYVLIMDEKVLQLLVEPLVNLLIFYVELSYIIEITKIDVQQQLQAAPTATVSAIGRFIRFWYLIYSFIVRIFYRLWEIAYNVYFYFTTLRGNNYSLTIQHGRRVANHTAFLQLRYEIYITRLIDVDRHCFRVCGRHLLPSIAAFYTTDFSRKKNV
jgi:hypothetical protein